MRRLCPSLWLADLEASCHKLNLWLGNLSSPNHASMQWAGIHSLSMYVLLPLGLPIPPQQHAWQQIQNIIKNFHWILYDKCRLSQSHGGRLLYKQLSTKLTSLRERERERERESDLIPFVPPVTRAVITRSDHLPSPKLLPACAMMSTHYLSHLYWF